jgi:hypothetical protein
LEPFLPDATVNKYNYNYLLPRFKTHSIDEIYQGYKEYIIACQEKLGDEGYDMLVENKRIRDAEIKAKTKAFFMFLLKVLIVGLFLFIISFLIYLQVKKRKKYLKLKSNINNTISNIENLKVSLSIFGGDVNKKVINEITENTLSKVTKKDVKEETLTNMNSIYRDLLDYKTTINTIKGSIENINKYKSDLKEYLKNNYPYCSNYLKAELIDVMSFVDSKKVEKMGEDDFNMDKRYKLSSIESTLNRKLNTFLDKVASIETIVRDNKNIQTKMKALNDKHNQYIERKNILAGAKIGKRYNSLVNLDYHKLISDLQIDITESFVLLEDGDYKNAMTKYSNYVTNLAVIDGAFNSVDNLYNKYQESLRYIERHKSEINTMLNKVKGKLNKSGVKHSHKKSYSDSKNDVDKFEKMRSVDVILAASLLATIISSLNSVYRKVKSAISDYEYSQRRSSYSSSSSSYGSSYGRSGGSFGGFGGGSFGGGGAGGSF